MRITAIVVFLMIVMTAGSVQGWKVKYWPIIEEVSSCIVEPGGSKEMNFTFRNKLNFDLVDAVLEMDIYMRLTEEHEYMMHEVPSAPTADPIGSLDYEVVPGIVDQYIFGHVESKERINIRLRVETSEKTPIGVYMFRLKLSFIKEGESETSEFWSRGHFTDEGFKDALNLTFPEGVAGTLPETSFEVISKDPVEVGYILFAGATVCFAAGLFYWWKAR
jgi:hypothetical protein